MDAPRLVQRAGGSSTGARWNGPGGKTRRGQRPPGVAPGDDAPPAVGQPADLAKLLEAIAAAPDLKALGALQTDAGIAALDPDGQDQVVRAVTARRSRLKGLGPPPLPAGPPAPSAEDVDVLKASLLAEAAAITKLAAVEQLQRDPRLKQLPDEARLEVLRVITKARQVLLAKT